MDSTNSLDIDSDPGLDRYIERMRSEVTQGDEITIKSEVLVCELTSKC